MHRSLCLCYLIVLTKALIWSTTVLTYDVIMFVWSSLHRQMQGSMQRLWCDVASDILHSFICASADDVISCVRFHNDWFESETSNNNVCCLFKPSVSCHTEGAARSTTQHYTPRLHPRTRRKESAQTPTSRSWNMLQVELLLCGED